jgi:hypothetical protein
MKTKSYYGMAKPEIPDINKGAIIEGNFYPTNDPGEASKADHNYYKR